MTVKSPSPVIMSWLWQAVPAEVPPTTAPRAKAAAIASPTGVSSSASRDADLVAAAEEDAARPGRRASAQSGRIASARFLMSSVTTFGQPYFSRNSFGVVVADVGVLGGGRDRDHRRLRPAGELDELAPSRRPASRRRRSARGAPAAARRRARWRRPEHSGQRGARQEPHPGSHARDHPSVSQRGPRKAGRP